MSIPLQEIPELFQAGKCAGQVSRRGCPVLAFSPKCSQFCCCCREEVGGAKALT